MIQQECIALLPEKQVSVPQIASLHIVSAMAHIYIQLLQCGCRPIRIYSQILMTRMTNYVFLHIYSQYLFSNHTQFHILSIVPWNWENETSHICLFSEILKLFAFYPAYTKNVFFSIWLPHLKIGCRLTLTWIVSWSKNKSISFLIRSQHHPTLRLTTCLNMSHIFYYVCKYCLFISYKFLKIHIRSQQFMVGCPCLNPLWY